MTIDNTQDCMDSQDIIERLEELKIELSDLDSENLDQAGAELQEEYLNLLTFASECENYASDWRYGVTVIHENYFEEYQDDLIADCYSLPKDLPYFIKITYDYDMLKQDYTEIDFDGETYYLR